VQQARAMMNDEEEGSKGNILVSIFLPVSLIWDHLLVGMELNTRQNKITIHLANASTHEEYTHKNSTEVAIILF
jgi:hypothetical protein